MLQRKPFIFSPKPTAWREIGAERSRSKIFIRRSIGIDTGSMEEEEKRMVMAISQGIKIDGSADLPTVMQET